MKGNAKNYSGTDSRNYSNTKEYDKGDLRIAAGGGLLAGGAAGVIFSGMHNGTHGDSFFTASNISHGLFLGTGACLLADGLYASRQSKKYM